MNHVHNTQTLESHLNRHAQLLCSGALPNSHPRPRELNANYVSSSPSCMRRSGPPAPLWSLVLALLVVMLTACGDRKFGWTEEVQLSSGEVIAVKRSATAQQLGEIGGAGGWDAASMSLRIERPQRPSDPAEWSFPFVPVVFDQDRITQEWFVVATFYTCEGWNQLGRPKLPYGEWRYRAGQWQRVELSSAHVGRTANMLTSIRSAGEPDHTLVTKEAIMSDRRIEPKLRRVFDGWVPLGC